MTATVSFDVADGMRIALVGGGKMGEAIMGGWIGAHDAPADMLGPANFVVANPGGERRAFLQERYGVACVDDARRIGPADLVVLAVKPQVMMGVLEGIKDEYRQLCNAFLKDSSVKNRTVGVGYISHEDALAQSMVGPFARASNVNYDARMLGNGGYGFLSDFQPILDGQGDCYARVKVRALEVLQSIDIIEEMIAKIPAGDIAVDVKGSPAAGAEAANVVEQPRGECYYYARGNGSKFLDRMRMRTPTSQNLAGMATALAGCDLADVNMIVLTIDPCISCTER